GEAAVGVAVVGDADVRTVREHGRLQRLEVRGPAPVVDVRTVRRGVDGDHASARAAQRLGRGPRRRAVGAVDDDGQPVEGVRQARDEMVDVPVVRPAYLPDTADTPADGPLPRLLHAGLDGVLDRVVELA